MKELLRAPGLHREVPTGERALEDAEDAREAADILSRIDSGQDHTYTMAEVAEALGLTLD